MVGAQAGAPVGGGDQEEDAEVFWGRQPQSVAELLPFQVAPPKDLPAHDLYCLLYDQPIRLQHRRPPSRCGAGQAEGSSAAVRELLRNQVAPPSDLLEEGLPCLCCDRRFRPQKGGSRPSSGDGSRVAALVRHQVEPPSDLRADGMPCLCCDRQRWAPVRSSSRERGAGGIVATRLVGQREVAAQSGQGALVVAGAVPPHRCLQPGRGSHVGGRGGRGAPGAASVPAWRRGHPRGGAGTASRAEVRTPHCASLARALAADKKQAIFKPPQRSKGKVAATSAKPPSEWGAFPLAGSAGWATPFR
mmetsp:Transcript_18720/g.65370  ORF Transcript_18720/g.65370 Transcript_18720/m.65370 type:complete len:303 (-) Transcript_18720:153-1061(-)